MQVGELTATLTLEDKGFLSSIQSAKSAFAGLSAAAQASGVQVGRNFSAGVASGISAGTGAIQAAARAAARAAKLAAEAELQVHSPSRVGASIGQNFGKGMAVGIEQMAREVGSAARLLARGAEAGAIPKPAQTGFKTQQYHEAQPQVDSRPTVLMLNGRELARAAADDNNHALGALGKQLSLGYGG